jgi:tRNA(Ile)-lysidine synthase
VLARVIHTVHDHDLIPAGCHVVAGVSGGADSVALLYALHHLRPRLSFSLTAVHVHHGLRGAEADADAEFVQLLAWRLGVPCVVEKVPVSALARRGKISLEMAGRAARYACFARLARALGADRVATAHHADDQVETLLLRLLRGTGLQGLGGMACETTINGLRIIRPMLHVRHADAIAFLRAHGLAWREDASNTDVALLRNRVRRDVLPMLEAHFGAAVRANMVRTAQALRDDQAWLDQLAEKWRRTVIGAAGEVRELPLKRMPAAARRRILVAWLMERGVPAERLDFAGWTRVETWLAGDAPRLSLPGARLLTRERGVLSLAVATAVPAPAAEFQVTVPGVGRDDAWGVELRASMSRGFVRAPEPRPGPGSFTAFLAAAFVNDAPLVVRTRRAGDRIRPLGLRGTIKVQDVLVDLKVPRALRDQLPLVTCRDEVVWLPGYRLAHAARVPRAQSPIVRLDLVWRGR